MDIEREDWLLIILVLGVAVPVGLWATPDGTDIPDTEIGRYCQDLAANIEANVSFSRQVDGCRCIPPSRVNESRFPAPDRVENATTLFLVECTLDDGSTQVFPVRRITENISTGNLSGTNVTGNTTVLN